MLNIILTIAIFISFIFGVFIGVKIGMKSGIKIKKINKKHCKIVNISCLGKQDSVIKRLNKLN